MVNVVITYGSCSAVTQQRRTQESDLSVGAPGLLSLSCIICEITDCSTNTEDRYQRSASVKKTQMEQAVTALTWWLWAFTIVHSRPAEDWNAMAKKSLQEALQVRHNVGVAKNVILFLGDGMGLSTVTAARIYKGQRQGQPGEGTQLNFEKFPHVALSKTYNVDRQTADSAGTATAFLCGVKTNFGTLGVDSTVLRNQCTNVDQGKVFSILHNFNEAGRSTGIVTTSRVTHATPAAAYAHSPERYWEGDKDMEKVDDLCKANVKDLTSQLVEDNPKIKVILGGGRRTFLPNDTQDPQTLQLNSKNGRRDSKNLVEEWQRTKPAICKARYVWNKDQLDDVDVSTTDFLLGLFRPSNMNYDLKRDPTQEPSLAEMVRKALGILRKDSNGFFLLVEGARIDHAHHYNYAKLALAETVAFDDALAVAMEMTGEDTLVVVTADHSHVFNIAGYPQRGNDILDVVSPVPEAEAPFDGMPYTTLVYANGPGPGRVNLTNVNTTDIDYQQSVQVRMNWETHGGEDVAIYATGPMSHLFHGVHEQNYIAHVMAYAACVRPYSEHCARDIGREVPLRSGGGGCDRRVLPVFFPSFLVLFVLTLLL